ncbi:hypothetical protein, partial [uncultured Bacteroides sp.]|uniref:hypothetical protein n=1 Tax=uncultured Bacteroides sp. TaxID=162156 RepID=UPI0026207243
EYVPNVQGTRSQLSGNIGRKRSCQSRSFHLRKLSGARGRRATPLPTPVNERAVLKSQHIISKEPELSRIIYLFLLPLFLLPLRTCLNFVQHYIERSFRGCFSTFMRSIAGYVTSKKRKTDREENQKKLKKNFLKKI